MVTPVDEGVPDPVRVERVQRLPLGSLHSGLQTALHQRQTRFRIRRWRSSTQEENYRKFNYY